MSWNAALVGTAVMVAAGIVFALIDRIRARRG